MYVYEYFKMNGVLTDKIKELIIIALYLCSNHKSSIPLHVKNAFKLGATREEIIETANVACFVNGKSAMENWSILIIALNKFDPVLSFSSTSYWPDDV